MPNKGAGRPMEGSQKEGLHVERDTSRVVPKTSAQANTRGVISQALWWIKSHRTMLVVAALLLLLDRVTKVWTLTYLAQHGPVVLGKYFWLNYVQNTGSAFGMFQHQNALLILVMLLIIGYIIYSWRELTHYGQTAAWGCMLILTGAFGNLYDRVCLGFVVDFIDWRVWPVFNVADSCITIGAVLVGIGFLKSRPKQEEK